MLSFKGLDLGLKLIDLLLHLLIDGNIGGGRIIRLNGCGCKTDREGRRENAGDESGARTKSQRTGDEHTYSFPAAKDFAAIAGHLANAPFGSVRND